MAYFFVEIFGKIEKRLYLCAGREAIKRSEKGVGEKIVKRRGAIAPG